MKTFVYVDGFNLYYGALMQRPWAKWLDPFLFAQNILPEKNEIEQVYYYTANLSQSLGDGAYNRQQRYLAALRTREQVQLVFGNFILKEKWVRPASGWKGMVKGRMRVLIPEEKGSDVNLATHLMRDAYEKRFEAAVVITNDTDLCEPIRLVNEDLKLAVGVVSPMKEMAQDLKEVAAFRGRISDARLRNSQLPSPIPGHPKLVRPNEWREATGGSSGSTEPSGDNH